MTELPLDPHVLDQLREDLGDPAFLDDLITSYLDEAPRLLTSIHDAIQRHDAAAMSHAAHTLKSTSATFGATEMATLCNELEKLGVNGDTNGAAERAATDADSLFQVVRIVLENEKRR